MSANLFLTLLKLHFFILGSNDNLQKINNSALLTAYTQLAILASFLINVEPFIFNSIVLSTLKTYLFHIFPTTDC